VHQLITTANSASRDGEDNPQTVDLQGNRDLIDAALQAGVQQYIFVSALLGEPFLEHPFMVAKQETESYLRASGLTYTILAPNAFIEGALIKTIGDQALAGGPVALIGSGEQSHSFIARSDVVSFAIAALDHPAAINSRLVLGGPKPLTLRGVVAEFRHLLERDIPIQIYQPGEPIPELDEFQVFILASYDAFESPIDMSGLCRTFDIQLRPMQVVIREVLAKN
jgi:NADH dehydrogenase